MDGPGGLVFSLLHLILVSATPQGAMDGVDASNTLWLHKAANWTGMLVEADPVSTSACC